MDREYYLWARQQMEQELASGFTSLKSLQTSLTWRFLHIMESLSAPARPSTWKSLLKRFHAEGAKAAGDPMTEEDSSTVAEYLKMLDASYAQLCRPPVSGKLASSRQMERACGAVFEDLLGVKPEKLGDRILRFVSTYRNGVIHTYLDASSRNYQLCYWHNIIDSSGQLLRERCSVLEWLGISSQTFWDGVPEAKIEPVVASIARAGARFIDFCEKNSGLY